MFRRGGKANFAADIYPLPKQTSTPAALGDRSTLVWGNATIPIDGTGRMDPGYSATSASATGKDFSTPNAGTFSRMFYRARVAGAGAIPNTFTLLVNGVASALFMLVGAGSLTGSNIVTTVAVVAGDAIGILIEGAGDSTPTDILISINFQAAATP